MNIGLECETVEFVTDMRQLHRGILSLTAMLNRSNHGTVYFGVDDNGDVVGMIITDITYEKIRNAVRNKVLPRILVTMEALESDDGKQYLKVEASGYDVPYSFDEKYYIRHGASNESATPDIVSRLVLSRRFDAMRELESYRSDIRLDRLNALMVSKGLHPRPEKSYLNSIGLLTRSGAYNLNAEILSDDNGLLMQVVEFAGTARTAFSKRTDYGDQCMFLAMLAIADSIRSRNETRIDVSSGVRKDIDLFDTDCFREAWFNACLHNSWRTGVPPQVAVFDDRIEVQSNGGIPYSLSLTDFYEGRSTPVNESLFRLAATLGFAEHTGRGVPTIVERYGRDAIRIDDASVTVTIPFAFEPSVVVARKGLEQGGEGTSDRDRKVLDYLRGHPEARISEVSDAVGSSPSAVKRAISSLKEKGVLENRGTNRSSRWFVLRRQPSFRS